MSSSPYLEGLEFKEATPSIAPSVYESTEYTRKWRVLLSIVVGCCLIGVCALGFYLSAQSRAPSQNPAWRNASNPDHPPIDEPAWQWRSLDEDECLITSAISVSCPADFGPKVTLVVAFGGLMPNQVKEIPALSELARCGVTTDSMIPSYPSLTTTSLYSVATGLYSESHGIVGSTMFDPVMNENFTYGEASSLKNGWWLGEPIWNTVRKQGKNSATYLWPGSDVKIQDMYPNYWQKDESPFNERIVKILDWIQLPPTERPQLIMMYYNEPTATAQQFGFFSDVTDDALRTINTGMDELITGLERADIFRCVDLIIISDHGTAPSFCEESIFVDDMLAQPFYARVFPGSIGRISIKDKEEEGHIVDQLQCQDEKMRVLTKDQVPVRYHYKSGNRIGDVVLDTKVGRRVATEHGSTCLKTEYGYNNLAPSMQSVFISHGPSFRNFHKTRSFRNVEIYNLLTILLQVKPAPNNGTALGLVNILKDGIWDSTKVTQPKFVFLDETNKPRPLRSEKAVIGTRGFDDEIFENTCRCDPDYVEPTTTTTAAATTTTTPTTTTPTTTSSTIAATTSTTTTTSTASTTTSTASTKASTTPIDDIAELVNATSSDEGETLTNSTEAEEAVIPSLIEQTTLSGLTKVFEKAPENSTTSPASEAAYTSVGSSAANQTVEIIPLESRRRRGADLVSQIQDSIEIPSILKDSRQKIQSLHKFHAPWGLPSYSAPEVQTDVVNVLAHTNHILGFPSSLNLALWTSFTVTREHFQTLNQHRPSIPEGVFVDEQDIRTEVPLGCWTADPRLTRSSSDQCSRSFQTALYNNQNISLRQLHPEEIDLPKILLKEGFLLSNLAPSRQGYENAGRRIAVTYIEALASRYGVVNVVHGPVFDYNHDGKRDLVPVTINTIKPLVPSSYFFTFAVCNQTIEVVENAEQQPEEKPLDKCPQTELEIYPVIFPNTHAPDNCLMDDEQYLEYHSATIGDIEKLTGLRLFRKWSSKLYERRKIHQPLKAPLV